MKKFWFLKNDWDLYVDFITYALINAGFQITESKKGPSNFISYSLLLSSEHSDNNKLKQYCSFATQIWVMYFHT